MSEYQRYEFMTCDRPLTPAQLEEVNDLSSHIEASSTHALIEYNWGDFKYDPIEVLENYFDGFLYWANWGSPQLALRFPHGILPADLLAGYDFDDLVTFTQHAKYDILDIHFGEMEGPDEWIEYELGSLIALRDELMEGDLRSLYVVWLAGQPWIEIEDEEDEEHDDDNADSTIPPVPPAFGELTSAQQALAALLQVPSELLAAAALHSTKAAKSSTDDFDSWVKALPEKLKDAYLLRLVQNEPGLSRQFIRELRELNRDVNKPAEPTGERVAYSQLLVESKEVKARLAREKRQREEAARLSRLQEVHAYQDTYWRQVEQAAGRGTASGYDEALQGLLELRDAAKHFKESQAFQARFLHWLSPHMRRPALLRRLRERGFPLPEA